MFFWITSFFMYTSSINRIVTLSLFLDSIISLLCQPKQHWRRPLLPSGTATFFFNSVIITNWGWSFTMLVCVLPHNLSDLEIS